MSSRRLRILCIEDDVSNIALLQAVLGAHGMDVTACRSGEDGLRLAAEERPDLTILDLGLPDRTGLEVLARLKRDDETCDIPVLVVSGETEPDAMREASERGSAGYLVKPWLIEDLLALVAELTEPLDAGERSAAR